MVCRLKEEILNQRLARRVSLLTIHDNPYILDKTIDDLKNLRCGNLTLVQRESIQPFQYDLIEIPSKELLYKCPCVVLSQIKCQRGGTHLAAFP
jgi:hypothetical protein